MQFYSPRRSTIRFVVLVGCISITLGAVIAIPIVTDATTPWDFVKEVVRILSPRPPTSTGAGGRGGDNIISPGVWLDQDAKPGSIGEVWNLRPVILYKSSGNASTDPDRIELIQDETIIQSFDVKDHPLHRQLPIKTELKPGKKYKIRQFLDGSVGPVDDGIEFVVMPDGPTRQSITEDLAKINDKFAKDEAKRSAARVQVFVTAGMWSDALQEARASVKTDKEWEMLKGQTIDQW
jgi:hypothetical protein